LHFNTSQQREFYDPSLFPDIAIFELPEVFKEIQREFFEVLPTCEKEMVGPGDAFYPQLKSLESTWKHYWLFHNEEVQFSHIEACPFTSCILASLPSFCREALFSILLPNTHIPPHTGNSNVVLRCHVGITGLEDCYITVGRTTRTQKEGKLLVFDDFLQHSAGNNAGVPRGVLIFDILRPGSTMEEYQRILKQMNNVIT